MHLNSSLWKNRDFWWLFSGRTISQLGTAVTTFTIPWLLLQLTGSATQTGVVFAIGFVPYLVFALPAGVWSDRYNRKTLMMFADCGRLLLLAAIPMTKLYAGQIPILLLYVAQGGVSLLSAIFDAAYGACLPNLVDRAHLQQGNAALQMGTSLSRMLGPVLAGLLVAFVGTVNTLVVDVSSYACSMITMCFIRAAFSASKGRRQTNMRFEVREGAQYVWKNKILRMLALFSMLVNLVGPGMDIALVYRMKDELHLSSDWAGIVMAGLSCGMLLGSFALGKGKGRIQMGSLLTASALGQVGPPFVLAATRSPWLILLMQVMIGFLLVAWNVQATSLRQAIVPDHVLGRCVSLFRMIAWVSIPIGGTLAGAVSERWGTPTFLILAAGVLATVCLLSFTTKLWKPEGQHGVSQA